MDAQIAPDESDLMESGPVAPQCHMDKPYSAASGELVVPLIPVSHRLWFGIFGGSAPDVDSLNRAAGMEHAKFPADMPGPGPARLFWFCVDEDLVYLSFSKDWGPLNVAMFYRFCVHVHQMLLDPEMADYHLVLYTTTHPHHKANAALLCALYSMTIDHICPADAFYPFSELEFMPFRDAGYGRADFCLSIQDVLYGVNRAIDEQLLDLTTFDLEEYEHYEQVQNGDWNWITRDFLAFASPKEHDYVAALASRTKPQGRMVSAMMRHTIKYFQEKGVTLVVRLNNPLYDRNVFVDAGIEHVDMYFDDGSNPSDEILRDFIWRADRVIKSGGRVAVHCKAGLGRTGVLIGAYLIWKHGFSAREIIGYMRLMRPGCVVGPQQHFMYENATKWVRWGEEDRLRAYYEKRLAEARIPLRETPLPQTPSAASVMRQKPTPCVGQPRKSPSPDAKRRRVGEAADTPLAAASPRKTSSSSESADENAIESMTQPQHTDEQVLGVLPTPPSVPEATPRTRSRPAPYARPETPGVRTRRALMPSQDRVGDSISGGARTPKIVVRASGTENVSPARKAALVPTRPATRTAPGHTAARAALRPTDRRRRRSSLGDTDVPA